MVHTSFRRANSVRYNLLVFLFISWRSLYDLWPEFKNDSIFYPHLLDVLMMRLPNDIAVTEHDGTVFGMETK